MSWTFKNSSNELAEVVWSASPTSGVIEPFGEIVVEVTVFSRGLNARETPYLGFFSLFSEDICICRDQSLEMALELIVTAGASATNSFVKLLDADDVIASGELYFHIVPVRRASRR